MAGILLQVCLRHNQQDLLLSVYIGKVICINNIRIFNTYKHEEDHSRR